MIYSNLAGTTSNTFQINDGAKFYKNLLPYNLNWQTNSFPDANIHEITTMGLDLNTIKTPGQYYCISRDVINSLVNCPVKDEGFLLTVEPSTGNLSTSLNHVHQCLTSYKGGIWHRWFGSHGEIFIGWVSVAYNETSSAAKAEYGTFRIKDTSNIPISYESSSYYKYGDIVRISSEFSVDTSKVGSIPEVTFTVTNLPYTCKAPTLINFHYNSYASLKTDFFPLIVNGSYSLNTVPLSKYNRTNNELSSLKVKDFIYESGNMFYFSMVGTIL